jgi:tetratricopeptide (TPR) repeat protein
LALAAGLWLLARRRRGPLAGFVFFAGTLFPVLGFLNVYPFLYSYVADHYQYLASLGIIVPLASGLTLATGRIPATARRWAPALAGLLLVTLGMLSWAQSSLYQNTVTLYTDTVARNPGCWMAQNILGRDLLDLPGRVPEAMSHLHEALRLRPNNSMSHDNLGKVYIGAARIGEAIAEFGSALRSSPDDPRTHNNLGIALARAGQLPQAIAAFDAALRLKPDYAGAHCNRGIALAQSGRLSEAIAAFETAHASIPPRNGRRVSWSAGARRGSDYNGLIRSEIGGAARVSKRSRGKSNETTGDTHACGGRSLPGGSGRRAAVCRDAPAQDLG